MTISVMNNYAGYNFNLGAPDLLPFNYIRQSFLHDLAREGDVLSAEIMFDAGSSLDLQDEIGRRPLHEAAFYGHLDMVAFLLDNGAFIDAPIQPFGHTALTLAVRQNRIAVVRELLRRGARKNVPDTLTGAGLLHIAAAKGDTPMSGILIASGIDVFYEDKKGMTARDTAAGHGHESLAQTLLKVMEHHAKYTG